MTTDDWVPHPGPQARFLSLTCYEALTGGSAGGGKTDMLLVDAIRCVGRGYGSRYKGVLFRRTFPELAKHVIPRSMELYPRIGGRYNANDHVWSFPGGEKVLFGHLQHEKDKLKYQGSEFQWVGFDELTQFLESQYLYLMSRMRTPYGVPLRIRGATNPGGPGHEWVFKRFGYWLDPETPGCRTDDGKVLYIRRVDDTTEEVVDKGTPRSLGRVFVRASLSDNPSLVNDETYRSGLDNLDPVTRAQLRDGNWLAKPAAGLYFKRSHITRWLDAPPSLGDVVARCRAWDLAATVDGDWTSGVLIHRLRDGSYVVVDVVRFRGPPDEVQRTIKATSVLDGAAVRQRLPQDPGQAGLDQRMAYTRLLAGVPVTFVRPTGDKVTRAAPFSAQWANGNVALVKARWNEAYVSELEAFPDEGHDDQVDASADAFAELTRSGPVVKTTPGSVSGQERRDMTGW